MQRFVHFVYLDFTEAPIDGLADGFMPLIDRRAWPFLQPFPHLPTAQTVGTHPFSMEVQCDFNALAKARPQFGQ